MRLLPFLLLLSITSFAQDLRTEVKKLIGERYLLAETVVESKQSARLMDAFIQKDEAGLDEAIEKADRSKFLGMDVYIARTEEELLEEIQHDTEASFHSPKAKAVSVSQVARIAKGGWELVVIYSYR